MEFKKKKILLILNTIPNNSTGGAFLYYDIIKKYGAKNFSLFSISSNVDLDKVQPSLRECQIVQCQLGYDESILFSKIISRIPLFNTFRVLLKYRKIKLKLLANIKNGEYDLIFIALRGDVILFTPVIFESNIPVYAMIEDTVEREIDRKLDLYLWKKRLYYEAIPKILKFGVAGESMKNYIENLTGKKATIMRASYPENNKTKKLADSKSLNVFFAGNIYAKSELLLFLKVFSIFATQNQNLYCKFYCASYLKFDKYPNLDVINLGWKSEESLVEVMNKCHFAYLPYKFDARYKHSMKYAFPGKLGFYLANNLPIFFHGPTYSSVNLFYEKYKIGVSCDSLDKKLVLEKLKEFVNLIQLESVFNQNILDAYKNEFSTGKSLERILDFFDT